MAIIHVLKYLRNGILLLCTDAVAHAVFGLPSWADTHFVHGNGGMGMAMFLTGNLAFTIWLARRGHTLRRRGTAAGVSSGNAIADATAALTAIGAVWANTQEHTRTAAVSQSRVARATHVTQAYTSNTPRPVSTPSRPSPQPPPAPPQPPLPKTPTEMTDDELDAWIAAQERAQAASEARGPEIITPEQFKRAVARGEINLKDIR